MAVQISGNDITVPRDGTFSRNVSIAGTLTYEDVTNVDSIGLVTARNGIEVGASPGVAASISVDGNMIVSGITTIGGDIKVGSGVTIGKDGHLFATGVTTSTTVKVGAAVTISESGIEASGIGITIASINGGQISGRKNLVINGSMRHAQRGGTSSTTTSEFVADRFRHAFSMGGGVTITSSRTTLTTSDSPYSEGHRYYIREALSGSTSDASSYYIQMAETRLEAQDISMSGWNYTDPNSKLTISFWARSSVAMTYGWVMQTHDGTAKLYPKSFALSANTWTKVKHSIPGHSDLTFNEDGNLGLTFKIYPFLGSGYCGGTDGAWSDQSAGKYGSDNTGVTWLNGANTFDVTGVQFEVGTEVTSFEHRSYGEELALCHRYYQRIDAPNLSYFGSGNIDGSNQTQILIPFTTEMRVKPSSIDTTGTASNYAVRRDTNVACTSLPTIQSSSTHCVVCVFTATSHGFTNGQACFGRSASDSAFLGFSAEL